MTKCFKVEINGRVTGVGFRFSALDKAEALPSLRGYVRNVGSGMVEALVSGEQKDVSEMLEWLKHGPSFARVDSFSATECKEPNNLEPFGII